MIEVTKTKPIKSTTSVEGILVQLSNGEYYGVTRLMIPRAGWYLRGSTSSKTGKLSMDNVFMKHCTKKPELDEGVKLLTHIMNGGDAILDKPNYNN